MADKIKLMTVVGTRPELIRLSETIKLADQVFEQILVHTGQNWDYNLNEVFFKNLGLRKPNHHLDSVGDNLGSTIGNIISKSYEVMHAEKPDALLVLGDTNSALSAIAAKRLKIPIFHMEAGNRCFDENVPEEINRRIVDHISDIHLPYTEHARRYLLSEGIQKEHIFVTGSPMTEVLSKNKEKIDSSKILEQLDLKKEKYFLISAHREENIDDDKSFQSLMNSLNSVAETYKLPIIYSTHPRSFKKIKSSNFKFNKFVKNIEPLGFFDYNNLQLNSLCTLSDSGTLSEESSILGFNGILIRTSTERPEVLDKGNVIIGNIVEKSILQSIELSLSLEKYSEKKFDVPDYIDTNVSSKVVKIIQSYQPIIKRNVWKQ